MNNCNPSDINQTFIIEPIIYASGSTSPIISACTAVFTNYIQSCDGNASIFLNNGSFIFSGDSFFSGNLSAQTITTQSFISDTYYSGNTTLSSVIQDYVNAYSGNTSGNCISNFHISNLYGCSPITLHEDLIPNVDDVIELGTPLIRFRNINTVSGVSTYWTANISISTPNLDLGLDSLGNPRIITADNSIIQNDFLNGGIY